MSDNDQTNKLEEAKKLLKVMSAPKDWADENSEFHRANIPSFKLMCIEQWLAAQDLISREEQRKEDAKIVKKIQEQILNQ